MDIPSPPEDRALRVLSEYVISAYQSCREPREQASIWRTLKQAFTSEELRARGLQPPPVACPLCQGSGKGGMRVHVNRGPCSFYPCKGCNGGKVYPYAPPPAQGERVLAVWYSPDEKSVGRRGMKMVEGEPVLLTQVQLANRTLVPARHDFKTEHAPGWKRYYQNGQWHAPVPDSDDPLDQLIDLIRAGDEVGEWVPLPERFHPQAWEEIRAGLDLWTRVQRQREELAFAGPSEMEEPIRGKIG